MLELYHNDMSTCAQKVRTALAEKGLEWTGHHLNLRAGDQVKPEYLKLNPNGVVPTLVNDGTVIIESTVINEYIDDTFGGTPLRPNDSADRARMRLWTKKLDEGMHANTGVISLCIAFRFQYLERGREHFEQLVAAMPSPAARERRYDLVDNGVESTRFPDAIKAWDRLLGQFEDTLKDNDWLAGSEFSLADVNYAPYMTRWEQLQLRGLWDKRPKLAAWFEKIKARPSYDIGQRKWFNAKYLALMEEKGAEAWPRVKAILAG